MRTVAIRLFICIQMVCVGLFAPVLPVQAEKPAIKKSHCCAEVLASAGKCHDSDADTRDSNTRSTCCFGQHCCVVLYLSGSPLFIARTFVVGAINGIDEHASTRVHRPPVPPPRVTPV